MTEQQPVPHPTTEDRMGRTWYFWKDTLVPGSTADLYRERKQLTDAELSAEVFSAIFHEAECEVRGRRIERGYPPHPGHPLVEHYVKQNREFGRQAVILERFATLPHASANGYQ